MPQDKPLAAIGMVSAAMVLLGLIDNLVAMIARDTGLWQFHAMRSFLALAMLAGLAAIGRARLRPNRLWAVALRGGMTALSMLLYFGCLGIMPVSQAAAGLFTAPIWVMLIGALFLGHRIGLSRVLAAALGFAGALLVLAPFRDGLNPVALVPVAAGLFYAIGNIATRQWCEGETTHAMLAFFFLPLGLIGLAGMALFTALGLEVPPGAEGFVIRGAIWPGATSWVLILVQSVGALVAVGLLFRGYQLGEAAQVAILEYSLLIFAAGWGWLLFGQSLSANAALGMALITLSGAVIASRGRAKPQDPVAEDCAGH